MKNVRGPCLAAARAFHVLITASDWKDGNEVQREVILNCEVTIFLLRIASGAKKFPIFNGYAFAPGSIDDHERSSMLEYYRESARASGKMITQKVFHTYESIFALGTNHKRDRDCCVDELLHPVIPASSLI